MPKAPFESVTLIVKLNVPCALEVPEMVTEFVVLALRERPVGSEPEEMVHENGATPARALTVLLYAAPWLPSGKEVVEITGAPSTVMESDLDWLGKVTEVAVTLSARDVPAAMTEAL